MIIGFLFFSEQFGSVKTCLTFKVFPDDEKLFRSIVTIRRAGKK